MTTLLTVLKLNAIHARIHELIKNADIIAPHSDKIAALGKDFLTGEEVVQLVSNVKASVYKELGASLGYHQVDSQEYKDDIFPTEPRIRQPETMEQIAKIFQENPFTAYIKDFGGMPPVVAVNSPFFALRLKEQLYNQVTQQVAREFSIPLEHDNATGIGR